MDPMGIAPTQSLESSKQLPELDELNEHLEDFPRIYP